LDAFDRLAFRRKVCRAIDERHADLDEWAKQYNEARTHQGRWCFGKLDRSAARPLKPAQVPCCNSGRLSQWMRDRRGRVTALAVRFMQTVPGPAAAPRTTSLCVVGPLHAAVGFRQQCEAAWKTQEARGNSAAAHRRRAARATPFGPQVATTCAGYQVTRRRIVGGTPELAVMAQPVAEQHGVSTGRP
jgi:hypothetical protein